MILILLILVVQMAVVIKATYKPIKRENLQFAVFTEFNILANYILPLK